MLSRASSPRLSQRAQAAFAGGGDLDGAADGQQPARQSRKSAHEGGVNAGAGFQVNDDQASSGSDVIIPQGFDGRAVGETSASGAPDPKKFVKKAEKDGRIVIHVVGKWKPYE